MTTVRVNLLPAAYEQRCRRSLRLRRWLAVAVVVIALQVPAFLVLRQLGRHARDLQRGLAAARQQRETVNTRLAAIALQQTEVDRQLAIAERLSRKHRWSELFASVAGCLPDEAVLTRLETDPPKSANGPERVLPIRSPAPAGSSESNASDAAGGLLIEGMAVDHDAIATFLRNLNAGSAVGQCSLESTQRQPLLKGEAVFFTVRTKW